MQSGLTPADQQLFAACRKLDPDLVSAALLAGADANAYADGTSEDQPIFEHENLQFTPLSLVAKTNYHKSRIVGTEASDIDVKAVAVTKLLLAAGADVDKLDISDFGNSCLHWAIVTYKSRLCALLIEHAKQHKKKLINLANNPRKPHYGTNPPIILALKCASRYLWHVNKLDLTVPEMLLANGANVNAADHFKQSVLHWAAIIHAPKTFFDKLFAAKASYRVNIYGDSPSRLYERKIQLELVDINAKEKNSFTELGFFIQDFNVQFAERASVLPGVLLVRDQNHDKSISRKLTSLEKRKFPIPTKAERYQATLKDRGWTELHYAAYYANYDKACELILEERIDVKALSKKGETALDIAKKMQNIFTVYASAEHYVGRPDWVVRTVVEIKAKECASWQAIEELLSSTIETEPETVAEPIEEFVEEPAEEIIEEVAEETSQQPETESESTSETGASKSSAKEQAHPTTEPTAAEPVKEPITEDIEAINQLKKIMIAKLEQEIRRLKLSKCNLFLFSPKHKINAFRDLITAVNEVNNTEELQAACSTWDEENRVTLQQSRTKISKFKSKNKPTSEIFFDKLLNRIDSAITIQNKSKL